MLRGTTLYVVPESSTRVQVTVHGPDAPGLAAALFRAFDEAGVKMVDVEQVLVGGRLLLGFVLDSDGDVQCLESALTPLAERYGVTLEHSHPLDGNDQNRCHQYVTLLAPCVTAGMLAEITAVVSAHAGNVERIHQLGTKPVESYELLVSTPAETGQTEALRAELVTAASKSGADVAVQPAGLYRRATRLVVLDVDSTLIQDECIDLLAARAGMGEVVAKVTAETMAGEIEFSESLRRRVECLQGLPEVALDEVRAELRLTPGAKTLIRTLHALGYRVGIVSGGFTQMIEPLAKELGLDHWAANTLEVIDGCLSGRIIGSIVDRPGKAAALVRFAEADGIPLAQTVAVGDGANDIDMLTTAGLGVAFNAKPVVRAVADTSLSAPYLDAILYLLGLSRKEIESASLLDPSEAEASCDS